MHLFYHVKFIPPIPIWAWEIDLSESWLKGICDHALDEDHMGSELFIIILLSNLTNVTFAIRLMIQLLA